VAVETVTTAASAVDPSGDELVRDARSRQNAARLGRRARLAFLTTGGLVAVAAVGFAAWLGTGVPGSLWKAALFLVVYAAATRVEFEVGSGSAVATQIVLVPMLFALPLGLVGIVVALGFVASAFADRPTPFGDPTRLLSRIANAAHALGPVIVLHFGNGLPLRWSAWPIYVAALAAQFAFDATAAVVGNLGHGIRPRTVVSFMAYAWTVDGALAPLGLAVAFAIRGHAYLIALTLPLIGLLRFFASERRRRMDAALELSDAYRGTALLLGDVIEAEDAYTGSHSRDVVGLVRTVSERLELSAQEQRDAEFAALLHDVGKIRMPADLLNKPGPLEPGERVVLERHAVEGERLLAQVGGLLGHVGNIVRSCHEHWDGNGYPDSLAGEQIPLIARIVCACDAYSAMTTDRPYRRAMGHEAAVAELRRCSGSQFDPRVVDVLLGVVSAAG